MPYRQNVIYFINMKNQAQQQASKFFTKKKIIIFSVSLVVFVAFVVLTSKFLFDINFGTIGNLITNSYQVNRLFFLWFFLLFIFPIFTSVFRIFIYWYKLRKKQIFVEWYNWLIFCFITFFIGAITPFSMGSEPYIIYWLKKRGLTLRESTAIVASFTAVYPFVQVLITWPSFFIICNDYVAHLNNSAWITSFWIVFAGLMCDLFVTIFWIVTSTSKNIHYWFNLAINKVKKILRLKYKSNEELKDEFKNKGVFRKLFFEQLKDWKFTTCLVLGSIIWNVLYYCSLIFAFNLMEGNFSFNPGDLFNYANVATTANNFIPIPGAEGSLQAILILFIQNSTKGINHDELKIVTNNSVFIWRTFTFYLTAIAGILALVALILKEFYKFIVNKMKTKNNIKKNSYTFLINNSNESLLSNTLLSLNQLNYDFSLIQIIIFSKKKITKKFLKEYPNLHIDIINKNFDKNVDLLKYANNKKLIKNDYVNLINSGDIIVPEILQSIQNIFHEYDIYACQYRINKNNNLSCRQRPYLFFYEKRFTKVSKKSTPFFDLFNFFIRKNIIFDIVASNKKFNNEWLLFNNLVNYSNKLRYTKKLYGYKNFSNIKKMNEKEELETVKKLISQNNQELAIYLILKFKLIKKLILSNQKLKISRNFRFDWIPWYIWPFFMCYFNLYLRRKIIVNQF